MAVALASCQLTIASRRPLPPKEVIMTRLEMVCENIVVGFAHGGGNDEKHELVCFRGNSSTFTFLIIVHTKPPI